MGMDDVTLMAPAGRLPRGAFAGLLALALLAGPRAGLAAATELWATQGEDKVLRDDTRVRPPGDCKTRAGLWCRDGVRLFGMGNETVAFQLVIPAPDGERRVTSVTFDGLSDGATRVLSGTPAACPAAGDCGALWSWQDRHIELFRLHYLPIRGISREQVATVCEEQLPPVMRRKNLSESNRLPDVCSQDPNDPKPALRRARWEDRPGADKEFPDVAVPLELYPDGFTVPAGTSQSLWVDVFIPKGTASGAPRILTGSVAVTFAGEPSPTVIPVRLEVLPRDLDDHPFERPAGAGDGAMRATVAIGPGDILRRYVGDQSMVTVDGQPYDCGDPKVRERIRAVFDRHHRLAHRHRIALIDGADGCFTPEQRWRWYAEQRHRLSGALFAAPDYDGPGIGKGSGIAALRSYNEDFGPLFRDMPEDEARGLVTQIQDVYDGLKDADPGADLVLYFCDEDKCRCGDPKRAYSWVGLQTALARFKAMAGNDRIKLWATVWPLPVAAPELPALDFLFTVAGPGDTARWRAAIDALRARPDRPRVGVYNSARPFAGSLMIDDSGTAPRQLAWAGAAWRLDEWFVWAGTYYCDYQKRGSCDGGERPGTIDLYADADTFHASDTVDPHWGRGVNNGNGVLFYPGADRRKPATKPFRDIDGPVASVRLKLLRRGLQDLAYIRLAEAVSPGRWRQVMGTVVDKALWDFGVTNPNDPTYVHSTACRSDDPADWETARALLASIILGEDQPDHYEHGAFTCWVNNPPPGNP